jgi:hypothetical protein
MPVAYGHIVRASRDDIRSLSSMERPNDRTGGVARALANRWESCENMSKFAPYLPKRARSSRVFGRPARSCTLPGVDFLMNIETIRMTLVYMRPNQPRSLIKSARKHHIIINKNT